MAIAGAVALLVVTGCGASSQQNHHAALVCKQFAASLGWLAIDHPATVTSDAALAFARKAERRPGYLPPSVATTLGTLLTSKNAAEVDRVVPVFNADCRAVGVKGQVWLGAGSY